MGGYGTEVGDIYGNAHGLVLLLTAWQLIQSLVSEVLEIPRFPTSSKHMDRGKISRNLGMFKFFFGCQVSEA